MCTQVKIIDLLANQKREFDNFDEERKREQQERTPF